MLKTNDLLLEFSNGEASLTDVDKINQALSVIGMAVWPLDLRHQPEKIQNLIKQPTLTADESEYLKNYFLLSREQLLEIIRKAGRNPHVEGGGKLQTRALPNEHLFPQLFMVQEGVDYSHYDRFHINIAEDGTPVDEFAQFLFGSGYVISQRLSDGKILRLHLDCADGFGWTLTYSGGLPHIGSVSKASVGTKILVQMIGPEKWLACYESRKHE